MARRNKTKKSLLEEQEKDRIEQEKQMIIDGCVPEESLTDRRVLFEMTGKRLIADEFPIEDETDEEVDMNVIVDQILGYDDDEVPGFD